jgi:hypothetical protein
MSADADFVLGDHLVEVKERKAEYERLCRLEGLDPDTLRRDWEAGEVDPDAGYDRTSRYYGKDVASLVMLLDQPLPHRARAR